MLYYILYLLLYLFHILLYRVIAPKSFFMIIKMCSLCLWQLRYYSIATPPFPTFATDTLPLLCNEAEQEHKLRHRKPKDNDNAITAAADSHVAHTHTQTWPCMFVYHASFNYRRIIVAVGCLSLSFFVQHTRKCSQVLRPPCQLILNRSLQRPLPCPCPARDRCWSRHTKDTDSFCAINLPRDGNKSPDSVACP